MLVLPPFPSQEASRGSANNQKSDKAQLASFLQRRESKH